jgi:hypothetical protein
MTKRAPLPPGMVRIHALIGRRAITREVAYYLRCRPRPARRGLTRCRDAATLWAAIEAGHYPRPFAGPFGLAWRVADFK